MPNASAMRATAPPMAPLPTTASVRPASPRIGRVKKQKSGDAAHAPRLHRGVVAGDVVRELQDQRERVLRDRIGRVSRDVRHRDARRARGAEIDGVRAGRQHADVTQVRQGRERRGGERNLVGQRRGRAGAARDDVAIGAARVHDELAQRVQPTSHPQVVALVGGEAVEDDDAHRRHRCLRVAVA
jgi:hypothetical protein